MLATIKSDSNHTFARGTGANAPTIFGGKGLNGFLDSFLDGFLQGFSGTPMKSRFTRAPHPWPSENLTPWVRSGSEGGL